jgi:hypothetical protein
MPHSQYYFRSKEKNYLMRRTKLVNAASLSWQQIVHGCSSTPLLGQWSRQCSSYIKDFDILLWLICRKKVIDGERRWPFDLKLQYIFHYNSENIVEIWENGCRRCSISKMVSLRVKAVNIKHNMVFNSLVVSKSVSWYIVTNKLL